MKATPQNIKRYCNTWVHQSPESCKTEVQLHNTIIVSFTPDTITLNSGGWQTVTTKKRMNEAADAWDLGFGVYQEKGEWWVCFRDPTGANYWRDKRVPYFDGMVLARHREVS